MIPPTQPSTPRYDWLSSEQLDALRRAWQAQYKGRPPRRIRVLNERLEILRYDHLAFIARLIRPDVIRYKLRQLINFIRQG